MPKKAEHDIRTAAQAIAILVGERDQLRAALAALVIDHDRDDWDEESSAWADARRLLGRN